MKKVNIGILGLGTVGSGVYRLLGKNHSLIASKSGIDIVIKKVCDKDIGKKSALQIPDCVFTTSFNELIEDPEVEILVELVGGTGVAKDFMLEAINNKKHIITANKALIAENIEEIFLAVVANNVEFGCEGSVGGGIPIIKTIREALVGNQINRIEGIVNGTTNFILTEMTREGMSFREALKTAQEKGFAEKDPSLDLSGGDACHKITILSSLAFNTLVDISRVYVEGIENIDEQDIRYALEFGYVVKLLARAQTLNNGIQVMVHPALVRKENPLAAVNWENNAIMVHSDFLGISMYSGKGAGEKPTASAVVADITDIALRIKSKYEYNKNCYSFFQKLNQIDFENSMSRYYFRFSVLDRPGILSKIAGVLGQNNISIASVIQKETEEEGKYVPLVMLTHTALEADVRKAIVTIDGFAEIKGKSKIIRIVEE